MAENLMKWQSASLSDKGNVREFNEDAALVKADIGLWAVADGMGGHEAGDVASNMIMQELKKLSAINQLSEFIDRIDDTLTSVNLKLRQLGKEKYNNRTIGSTVVTLISIGDKIAYLWAGDSRIYRVRDGQIKQITRDHSEVQNLIERGLLLPEDAESHPSANVITRAIGASDQLYLSVGLDAVREGDTYLLCSDGLYRDITDYELLQLSDQENVEKICSDMMRLALAREGKDNITVIIAKSITDNESN